MTRQDVIDIITEYEAQYGSALGDGTVRELTPAELTDENLRVLTIPGMKPSTQEWVQTNMANMMVPINNAVSDLTTLKAETIEAKNNANSAAASVNVAVTHAENVNATLVGATVTITDRTGTSRSVNIGFYIDPDHVYPSYNAMLADAGNVAAGQFCMIATTDPTSTENAQLWSRNSSAATSEHPYTFLSDLDQASSAAWADWMENYKPTIEGDHTRAEQDHATATQDHSNASQDHSRAGTDHSTATDDHTQAGQDHTRAETDHTRAETDHTTAGEDHTQAGTDHNRAETDHSTATTDHNRANTDHETAVADNLQAGRDHNRAETDHSTAIDDHRTAGADHEAATQATNAANTQANRAKGYNDHPWEIRSDGFIYVWDEQSQTMVRTNKMIIDFSGLTPEQQASMMQEFLSHLTFDETPTPDSPNAVTSRGLYTAFSQKQDTLTFASDALCVAAAAEIVFA